MLAAMQQAVDVPLDVNTENTTETEAKQGAKQVNLVKRMIDVYYPEAQSSPKGLVE